MDHFFTSLTSYGKIISKKLALYERSYYEFIYNLPLLKSASTALSFPSNI